MNQFLPVTKADLAERGWEEFDFLVITGDAYVDHPSFGPAIISRVLEAEGYRVAILAQPDWRKAGSFTALGRPRLGVLLSSGNIDSMVAHYTVAKKRRHDDAYSPGNRAGLRPDRAVIVYANKVREAFGDIPLVIGGLEASLRRFAHYDYWEDKVRRAILFDSQADLLVYGMGERATREIAARLASGTPIREITDVKGTTFIAKDPSACAYPKVECPSFEAVSTDKRAYAQANQIQYEEHDPVRGKAILQRHGDRLLVVNPPAMPLTTAELDFVAELPYVREPHPMYDEMGGVPAIEEVRFSVAHNRGCFGACNFCSLAFHQGLPGPHALSQSGRRPHRLFDAPAQDPAGAGGEEGVHPLRHPLRLYAPGQERRVLCRAGEVSCLRPAQGGPGALCERRTGLHGQAPYRGL